MAQSYPSMRFRADGEIAILNSPEEEESFGAEWKDSPAAFGVETHPAVCPKTKKVLLDPKIAKNTPKEKK